MLKSIFAYEKELGLTQHQVQSLKDILSGFQDFLNDKVKEITNLRTTLNDMIAKQADIKAIRGVLEQMSRIQIDISCNDIETARKVPGVLMPSQFEKWKQIQEKARKQVQQTTEQAQEKLTQEQPAKTGK